MRKIAITGIRKAAQAVGNYLGRKSLRGVARVNRAINKTTEAADKGIAATIRGARKVGRRLNKEIDSVAGPVGLATRNASARVIKATRHARPRARETMGQINRRKGIVNKVHYPSQNEMNAHRNTGFPAVRDLRKTPRSLKDMKTMVGDVPMNVRGSRRRPTVLNMHEYGANADDQIYRGISKGPAFDRSKLSYDGFRPTANQAPRYTSKQVRAGRRVIAGTIGAAGARDVYNSYRNQKNDSR